MVLPSAGTGFMRLGIQNGQAFQRRIAHALTRFPGGAAG